MATTLRRAWHCCALLSVLFALFLACGGESPPQAPPDSDQALSTEPSTEAPAPGESLELRPIVDEEPEDVLCSLSGRALNASGEAISGLTLHLLPHPQAVAAETPDGAGLWEISPTHTAQSDAGGQFTFEEIQPGRWWLAASPSPDRMFLLAAPLSVDSGWNVTDFEMTVPGYETVATHVTSANGTGVADAAVHLSARLGEVRLLVRTATDAQGRAEIPVLSHAESSLLRIAAPGFSPFERRGLESTLWQSNALSEITLSEGAAVEGTAIGPDGEPIPDALIWATRGGGNGPRSSQPPLASTRSAPSGTFRLDGLPSGPLELRAMVPGMRIDQPISCFALPGDVLPGQVIAFRRGAALRGTVMDEDDKPVSGALVCLLRPEPPMRFDRFAWGNAPLPVDQPDQWTFTDETGAFALEGVRPGEARDVAVVAAAAPQTRFSMLLPQTQHVLTLQRGSTVAGAAISTATRRGINRATVSLHQEEDGIEDTTLTNALGDFALHFTAPGSLRAHASAPDHASTTRRGIGTQPGDTLRDLILRLTPGVALSGHVRDRLTLEPIPGAEIALRTADDTLIGLSDSLGAFRVEHVAPGEWQLSASAPLHVDSPRTDLSVGDSNVSDLSILLDPSSRAYGRVIDSSNRGIPGALVGVRYTERRGGFRPGGDFWGPENTVTTDTEGRFSLDTIQPDREFSLMARHESHAQATLDNLRLEPGANRGPLDIIMLEGGTLRGRVIDERNLPIADAEVRHGRQVEDQRMGRWAQSGPLAVMIRGPEQGENVVHTDAQGRFRFAHLLPGDYTVAALTPDHPYQVVEDVAVNEGMESEEVQIQLTPGVTLSGRVLDPENNPIPAATVRLIHPDRDRPLMRETNTDESGRFDFRGLDEASFMLMAEADGYDQATENFAAPTGDALLVLQPAATLFGVVVDAATTEPIIQFSVSARRRGRGGFGGPMGGRGDVSGDFEDPNGQFSLSGVVAGEWDVTASASGYGPTTVSGIEVANGTEAGPVTIALPLGITLRGEVLTAGEDPNPIPGALVQLRRGGGWQRGGGRGPGGGPGGGDPSQSTDENGEFQIDNLTPGSVTVLVEAPGYLEAQTDVTLTAEEEPEPLTIVLRQGGRVTGRVVLSSNRRPVVGARITLPGVDLFEDQAPDLTNRGVTSDEDGRFEMLRVPPGNARLRVSHPETAELETNPIVIAEGEETDVGDLILMEGGRIQGFAFDAEGNFLTDAGIFITGPNESDRVSTDENGEFHLTHLTPGQYRLTLSEGDGGGGRNRAPSGTRVSQTVTVRDGEETEVILAVVPGYTLSGQITDEGSPVADIQVQLTIDDPDNPLSEGGSAVSDDSGQYEIENLGPGTYSVVVSQMQRRRQQIPLRRDELTIRDANATLDIALPRGSIAGTVTNTSGEPLDGARVTILRDTTPQDIESFLAGGMMGDESARTDGAGQYQIERVQEGDVTLIARLGDETAYATRSVSIGYGEEVAGIDFTLDDAARLTGTATARANGQPVPSFYVIIEDAAGVPVRQSNITVDPIGAYSVGGLAEGSHTLSAFADGFAPLYDVAFSTRAGAATELDLEFEEGGTLNLTVESRQGEPISGARVEVLTSDGQPMTLPPTWSQMETYFSEFFTDGDGHAVRNNLPNGRFTVRVTHADHNPASDLINFSSGETRNATIRLDPVE